MHSDVKINKIICSDVNNDLISLWLDIKNRPQILINNYNIMWQELNLDDDLERKKQYFYKIRKKFNEDRNPKDFLFISRTTTNGLIRYNKKGEFNNSFHVTRNGIKPKTLEKIILDWSHKIKNIEFICCDYKNINAGKNDFIYLDPPYAGTKGMYYGTINYEELWSWLSQQKCRYLLSFDGVCGKENRTYDVPQEIYNEHKYLYSGCSSFKRLKEQKTEYVKESIYIK